MGDRAMFKAEQTVKAHHGKPGIPSSRKQQENTGLSSLKLVTGKALRSPSAYLPVDRNARQARRQSLQLAPKDLCWSGLPATFLQDATRNTGSREPYLWVLLVACTLTPTASFFIDENGRMKLTGMCRRKSVGTCQINHCSPMHRGYGLGAGGNGRSQHH